MSEKEIQIHVESLMGNIVTFKISREKTVWDINVKLCFDHDFPVNKLRLVYRNKVLQSQRLISDYNLQNDSTIRAAFAIEAE